MLPLVFIQLMKMTTLDYVFIKSKVMEGCCLKIRFPNGDIFRVPAKVIAENRADYYSEIDGYDIGSNEWVDQVEYAMDDEFELKDWLAGNMDWSDLEPHAEKIDEEGALNYYENNFSDAEIRLCNNES